MFSVNFQNIHLLYCKYADDDDEKAQKSEEIHLSVS